MKMRKVVSVVGAGNVGEHTASLLAIRGLVDVRMFDLPKRDGERLIEPVKGKALDIQQMLSALNIDGRVEGYTVSPEGDGYEALEGSDIVIITAGFPRRPGMSREDLLDKNIGVLQVITSKIKQYAKDAIVIVVTNPVDLMTYAAYRMLGFPKERVIGMAGVLDSARFKTFISREIKVSPQDIHAYVIGGHGDEMVPLISISNVGGIPLKDMLSKEKLNELIKRTQFGGGEIVDLMGTSAYHAPAASIVEMVEAIVTDNKRILPCSVYLEGETGEYYGVEGFCVGVPVKLGNCGVEDIIKIPMLPEEREMWQRSVESVRRNVKTVEELLNARSAV
ncbi:malate dehydrogenase, NAD-dependent [Thermocrinis albus DSM 14484]|uniref:Malate dehydrogenase n=1 Tax=Thermocrinis albus (strain DSM 14484 / JCM 11386 / HI 11/12) TaxID=638303 RepID=D3SQ80_THEAH|nr:malate dehydrogenase [Thermocrinis albus]ADC89317.1 malate dehydrogenase, NAD-dependent [Thermocrinis albus DSM 14484]